MPKTNADYQREHRRRQARRLTGLQADNAALRTQLDSARAELDAALANIERLTASQCKHPAGAVDGSHCRACDTDLW